MRILFYSVDPSCQSGYGNVTRELVTRLKKQGHFLRISTKHGSVPWHKWNGIEVFEGTNIAIINEMLEAEKFDYLVSLFDIWIRHSKRHFPKDKWVSHTPVDTEWISDILAEVCLGKDPHPPEDTSPRGPGWHIAMSKHGERELKSIGLKPWYAPLGINTKVFRPKPEGRKAVRKEFGWTDDNFVIGSVGLNYADDRKGFIPLMRAYKEFQKEHPEARLYLHTHMDGKYPKTINYTRIARKIGLPHIAFPQQASNDIGRIDEEWLVDVYNSFDVFCLPTRGEGWGLPICEAMACGIPVITTRTTTGPELAGHTGWLISVDKLDDAKYLSNNCFRLECRPSEILKCLHGAYNFWKYSNYQNIKDDVRKFALGYDWDLVWEKYWQPIFDKLENRLK